MQRPVTTAKKTTAKMLPFWEKVAAMLFGIAFTITNNGLEPALPAWEVKLSILTLNNPILFAANPKIPANIRANNDVTKNPNIVL